MHAYEMYAPNEHAREVHKMHAYKVQANETHAREIYAPETHAYKVYPHGMYTCEIHVHEIHAYPVALGSRAMLGFGTAGPKRVCVNGLRIPGEMPLLDVYRSNMVSQVQIKFPSLHRSRHPNSIITKAFQTMIVSLIARFGFSVP